MGTLLELDIPGEEKPVIEEERHNTSAFPCCGFITECHCADKVKQNNIDIASDYVASGRW